MGFRINKKNLFLMTVCVLILGYLAAFAIVNFLGFTTFITPDIYSDTLVARYMWEEKSIFPEQWVFGNQYYVIATPVLAALFYGLTGSMNTAMALATTAMILLLFLCLYAALRPYVSLPYCLLAILTFAASNIAIGIHFNFEAQLLFCLASYYACYMITAIAVFADYVRSLSDGGKTRPAIFLVCAFLCFCTGIQSIRQTAIMIVPLLGFECLRIIHACMIQKKQVSTALLRPAYRVAGYTIANLLGIWYIKYLDIPACTIYGQMSLSAPSQWGENLKNTLEALKGIIGFGYMGKYEHSWFIAVFAVLTLLFTIAALIHILLSKRWNGLEYYIVLFDLSILALFFGSIFVDLNIRSLYFFLWYPAMALSQVYLLLKLKNRGKTIFAGIVLLLCASNLLYSYIPNIQQIRHKEETAETAAAKWLCDNGYETVYGPYWPVAYIGVETDGQVIAACWWEDVFVGLDYINALDLYAPERNEKAAYYITDDELETAMAYAENYGGLTCLVDFGGSGLYRSDVPLMRLPE